MADKPLTTQPAPGEDAFDPRGYLLSTPFPFESHGFRKMRKDVVGSQDLWIISRGEDRLRVSLMVREEVDHFAISVFNWLVHRLLDEHLKKPVFEKKVDEIVKAFEQGAALVQQTEVPIAVIQFLRPLFDRLRYVVEAQEPPPGGFDPRGYVLSGPRPFSNVAVGEYFVLEPKSLEQQVMRKDVETDGPFPGGAVLVWSPWKTKYKHMGFGDGIITYPVPAMLWNKIKDLIEPVAEAKPFNPRKYLVSPRAHWSDLKAYLNSGHGWKLVKGCKNTWGKVEPSYQHWVYVLKKATKDEPIRYMRLFYNGSERVLDYTVKGLPWEILQAIKDWDEKHPLEEAKEAFDPSAYLKKPSEAALLAYLEDPKNGWVTQTEPYSWRHHAGRYLYRVWRTGENNLWDCAIFIKAEGSSYRLLRRVSGLPWEILEIIRDADEKGSSALIPETKEFDPSSYIKEPGENTLLAYLRDPKNGWSTHVSPHSVRYWRKMVGPYEYGVWSTGRSYMWAYTLHMLTNTGNHYIWGDVALPWQVLEMIKEVAEKGNSRVIPEAKEFDPKAYLTDQSIKPLLAYLLSHGWRPYERDHWTRERSGYTEFISNPFFWSKGTHLRYSRLKLGVWAQEPEFTFEGLPWEVLQVVKEWDEKQEGPPAKSWTMPPAVTGTLPFGSYTTEEKAIRLFVYGTLCMGHEAHDKLAGLESQKVKTAGNYRLTDKSGGKALEPNGSEAVEGEVYLVDVDKLRELDAWEHEHFERRPVELEDGSQAQAYFWKPSMAEAVVASLLEAEGKESSPAFDPREYIIRNSIEAKLKNAGFYREGRMSNSDWDWWKKNYQTKYISVVLRYAAGIAEVFGDLYSPANKASNSYVSYLETDFDSVLDAVKDAELKLDGAYAKYKEEVRRKMVESDEGFSARDYLTSYSPVPELLALGFTQTTKPDFPHFQAFVKDDGKIFVHVTLNPETRRAIVGGYNYLDSINLSGKILHFEDVVETVKDLIARLYELSKEGPVRESEFSPREYLLVGSTERKLKEMGFSTNHYETPVEPEFWWRIDNQTWIYVELFRDDRTAYVYGGLARHQTAQFRPKVVVPIEEAPATAEKLLADMLARLSTMPPVHEARSKRKLNVRDYLLADSVENRLRSLGFKCQGLRGTAEPKVEVWLYRDNFGSVYVNIYQGEYDAQLFVVGREGAWLFDSTYMAEYANIPDEAENLIAKLHQHGRPSKRTTGQLGEDGFDPKEYMRASALEPELRRLGFKPARKSSISDEPRYGYDDGTVWVNVTLYYDIAWADLYGGLDGHSRVYGTERLIAFSALPDEAEKFIAKLHAEARTQVAEAQKVAPEFSAKDYLNRVQWPPIGFKPIGARAKYGVESEPFKSADGVPFKFHLHKYDSERRYLLSLDSFYFGRWGTGEMEYVGYDDDLEGYLDFVRKKVARSKAARSIPELPSFEDYALSTGRWEERHAVVVKRVDALINEVDFVNSRN